MKSTAHHLNLLNQSFIYQVFVGRWQSASIIDHQRQVFQQLKNLPFENLSQIGVDTIYLLGVFNNRSPIIVSEEEGMNLSSKEDRSPSPFAISDHSSTNVDLGSISQLKDLISTLHSKGFKVILDFVPNHTSTTHPWTNTHPNYYANENGSFIAEFSGDVFKLDYQNPDLRIEMIEVLKTIQSWGADGVRCDMAHLIPQDFWKQAINEIKSINSNFVFYGEVYSDSPSNYQVIIDHIQSGFDGVYHHALYENFKKVFSDHQPEEFITDHISYINSQEAFRHQLINYIENHDDHSPIDNKPDLIKALEFMLSCSGKPFLYNGTLNLFQRRIAHHFIDILPDEFNEIFNIDNVFLPKKSSPPILKSTPKKVLGIDIGGTNIKAALVDENGDTFQEINQNTNKENYSSLLNQLESIIESYDHNSFSSIGLSVPGIFNKSGEVIFPGSNLPFIIHKNIKNDLASKLKAKVVVENDANCFALAESTWGIGRGKDTIIGITWGTGIGAGIIIDGKIHHGTGAAGEFGHISTIGKPYDKDPCACGIESCLEKCSSGAAIINKFHQLHPDRPNLSVKDVFSSVDPKTEQIISEAIFYLGIGIADLIKILSPDIVVLGGGLSQMNDSWYLKLQQIVDDHIINDVHTTSVVRHSLSKDAGIMGAALLAMKGN